MLILWSAESAKSLAALKGHTGTVTGALQLSGGRLLSWSEDKILVLWSAETGERLATLQGHANRVRSVRQLPDGSLLSCSNDGIGLWDSQTGAALGFWIYPQALYRVPEFLRETLAKGLRCGCAGGWAMDRGAYCVIGGQRVALWHGDGELRACQLYPDGSLVVSCGKLLHFLQLYQGNRRVTLDEASHLYE
jgi:hypothetical protein